MQESNAFLAYDQGIAGLEACSAGAVVGLFTPYVFEQAGWLPILLRHTIME
jgi:hypothetical protein